MMTNEAMGTKRLCASCAARFFDMGHDPIHCPKCDAVFVVPIPPPPRRPRFLKPEATVYHAPETLSAAEPPDVLLDDGDETDTLPPEKDEDDLDEPNPHAHVDPDEDDLPVH